jgi:hypothetical protein
MIINQLALQVYDKIILTILFSVSLARVTYNSIRDKNGRLVISFEEAVRISSEERKVLIIIRIKNKYFLYIK